MEVRDNAALTLDNNPVFFCQTRLTEQERGSVIFLVLLSLSKISWALQLLSGKFFFFVSLSVVLHAFRRVVAFLLLPFLVLLSPLLPPTNVPLTSPSAINDPSSLIPRERCLPLFINNNYISCAAELNRLV